MLVLTKTLYLSNLMLSQQIVQMMIIWVGDQTTGLVICSVSFRKPSAGLTHHVITYWRWISHLYVHYYMYSLQTPCSHSLHGRLILKNKSDRKVLQQFSELNTWIFCSSYELKSVEADYISLSAHRITHYRTKFIIVYIYQWNLSTIVILCNVLNLNYVNFARPVNL